MSRFHSFVGLSVVFSMSVACGADPSDDSSSDESSESSPLPDLGPGAFGDTDSCEPGDGCGDGDGDGDTNTPVDILNLGVGIGAVDIVVDGEVAYPALDFRSATVGTVSVPTGTHVLDIVPSGQPLSASVATVDPFAADGFPMNLVVFGDADDGAIDVREFHITRASCPCKTFVDFFHAAPALGLIELWWTPWEHPIAPALSVGVELSIEESGWGLVRFTAVAGEGPEAEHTFVVDVEGQVSLFLSNDESGQPAIVELDGDETVVHPAE